MELTGIRILAFNFQKWDSPAAMSACEVFASRLPGLLGILAFQYYPYPAGEGAIRWVKGADGDEVPVVSCRFCIWAQTGRPRETTPAAVAAWLNRMPVADPKASDECFSWVLTHAWSRFRSAPANSPLDAEENGIIQDKAIPGTVRGYDPMVWTAGRLGPQVKPVTVQELLLRIRLRLRPQTTLGRWLGEVEARLRAEPAPRDAMARLSETRTLLTKVGRETMAAPRCLELLKGLHALPPRQR